MEWRSCSQSLRGTLTHVPPAWPAAEPLLPQSHPWPERCVFVTLPLPGSSHACSPAPALLTGSALGRPPPSEHCTHCAFSFNPTHSSMARPNHLAGGAHTLTANPLAFC